MKKIIVIAIVVILVSAAFLAGHQSRRAEPEPARPAASLVCLGRDTALRASSTGYIIVRLAKGTQLWVTRIDTPFAYVSYYDGRQWIDGSVTAAYLGRCGTENNVEG